MKKELLIVPLLLTLVSCGPSKLEDGIAAYRSGDNIRAERLLTQALKQKKDRGKVSYYLGNVYMNLSNFGAAISSYESAYYAGYEQKNSLFNLACAHSLSGNPERAFQALMQNYEDHQDSNLQRIARDPDLKNFRNSKFYRYLRRAFNGEYTDEGKAPQNGEELFQAIRNNDLMYPYAMPTGFFYFHSNHSYWYSTEGDSGLSETYGKWSTNDTESLLILIEMGETGDQRILKGQTNESEKYPTPSNWISIRKPYSTNSIPYSKIHINVREFEISYDIDTSVYYIYNQIGPYKIGGRRLSFDD